MLLEVIENVLNDFKSNVLPLENSTSVPTPNLTPKPTPNPSVVYTPKQTRMQSRICKIKKYLHLNQIKILRMKLQTTKKTYIMKYLGNILGIYILHIISDQLKNNQIENSYLFNE